MIINEDSRVVNKLEASLTDGTRVVIHIRHMFIVQATGGRIWLISTHSEILNLAKRDCSEKHFEGINDEEKKLYSSETWSC